ncbi:MAG TPA: ADP-ribosylglycohydrolase family protein [Pirellulaceae bacterium]|nr:ADP-ribosylglycohydrolase family protein [Pirellulaceae bacterium]
MNPDHADRLALARLALDGLSVGDAFGQQFFADLPHEIATRTPPLPPWQYTDDTEMALAIFEVLSQCAAIDQDRLARQFARRYMLDAGRGYGAGARMILQDIADGSPWYVACRQIFGGQGSLGNGAAMRVAPLGAYFAADVPHVIDQAAASAEVTHAHPEGIAGAVAVALAAAWATRRAAGGESDSGQQMLMHVLAHTPDSAVRRGIEQALAIPLEEWEFNAASALGNGSQITAADTVPFCLWCAAAHVDSYSDALWAAVRVGGDIDTNAAIVGGIVALAVGREGIPVEWLRAREGLVFLGHQGPLGL